MTELNTAESFAPDEEETGTALAEDTSAAPEQAAAPETEETDQGAQNATSEQEVPEAAVPSLPAPIDPANIKSEADAHMNDMNNGLIKPKTMSDLYNDKSTTGKIGTIFGLMLSGAGSGLTHQPNALLDIMNKQLDRDLEAQKSTTSNRNTLYGLNLQHQRTIADIDNLKKQGKLTEAQTAVAEKEAGIKANALTRIQMNNTELHNLVGYANKLPVGSPEKNAADQKLMMLSSVVKDENYSLADRAAALGALGRLGMSGGAGAQQTTGNPENAFQNKVATMKLSGNPALAVMAKDMEDKHVPGIPGQASIPLNSADRENINSGVNFQNELARFTDWTKKHSGDLNPSDRKEGEALAGQLQGAFRLATHGGVYKEGEQGFISNIIDSTPTKFFNQVRVLPALKAVQGESSAQLDQLLKSKGFEGYPGASGASTAVANNTGKHEGKTATGPNGEKYVVKNGKWVPVGGSAIGTREQ